MTDVKLKKKVTLRAKQPIGSDGFTPPPQERGSKLKWIVSGIVLIAVLLGGYAYYNNTNEYEDRETQTALTNVSDNKEQADSTETSGKENPTEDEQEKNEGTPPQNAPDVSIKKDVNAGERSERPMGSVEEKARQVIRGNYGNGQVRKDKLGDEYQTIQDMVNEMYRNGSVK